MSDEQNDDEFIAQVSSVVDSDVDDVPDDLRDFARAALTWSVVEEELAELVDAEGSATVRSDDVEASAVFDVASREIAVAVRGEVLVGDVSPSDDGLTIEIETLELIQPVDLDERGRFRATGVRLPLRVRLEHRDAPRRAVTPWLTHWSHHGRGHVS